jgi:MATE family multidrug resistance protein
MAPGRGELRPILSLALPLAAAQVAQMLMGITDAAVMGHLGGNALASGSLATNVGFFLIMVVQGVLTAIQALIARARGAARAGQADEHLLSGIVFGGLLVALAAGLPIILAVSHIDRLLVTIGEPADLAANALLYGRAFAWGVPAALVFWTLRNTLSALERPRVVMAVVVAAAPINLLFNWLLVFGHGGLPALGLAGSGYATALVMWGMAISLALYLLLGPVGRQARSHRLPDMRAITRGFVSVLRLGWAIGAVFAVEAGLFSSAALLMGYFGPVAISANQICIGVASCTFMVPLGISQAAMVRVGRHVGSGDIAAARRAGRAALWLAVTFMTCSAIAILAFSTPILGLYLNAADPRTAAVQALGHQLLRLAALFQIFDGVQVVCLGILRGFADTRVPFYAGCLAYWGLAFPGAIAIAFGLGYGPPGIWWGFVIGLVTISLILPFRIARVSRRAAAGPVPCRV